MLPLGNIFVTAILVLPPFCTFATSAVEPNAGMRQGSTATKIIFLFCCLQLLTRTSVPYKPTAGKLPQKVASIFYSVSASPPLDIRPWRYRSSKSCSTISPCECRGGLSNFKLLDTFLPSLMVETSQTKVMHLPTPTQGCLRLSALTTPPLLLYSITSLWYLGCRCWYYGANWHPQSNFFCVEKRRGKIERVRAFRPTRARQLR